MIVHLREFFGHLRAYSYVRRVCLTCQICCRGRHLLHAHALNGTWLVAGGSSSSSCSSCSSSSSSSSSSGDDDYYTTTILSSCCCTQMVPTVETGIYWRSWGELHRVGVPDKARNSNVAAWHRASRGLMFRVLLPSCSMQAIQYFNIP